MYQATLANLFQNTFNLTPVNWDTTIIINDDDPLQRFFIPGKRRMLDTVRFGGEIIYVFVQEEKNGLGVPDPFRISLIEREKWNMPENWNWRELTRFKKMPGLRIGLELYERLKECTWTLSHSSYDKRAKIALYVRREDKFYWAKIAILEKFISEVGMLFYDEYTMKKVLGFPKSLFDEVTQ